MDKQGTTFELLMTKSSLDDQRVTLGYRWERDGKMRRSEIALVFIDEMQDLIGRDFSDELEALKPGETLAVDLEIHSTWKVR